MKFYETVDWPSLDEWKLLGFDLNVSINERMAARHNIKAKWTGERRCPKAGEWYLSGAIPEAYKASNDLSTPYPIAILVKTKTVTVVVEV